MSMQAMHPASVSPGWRNMRSSHSPHRNGAAVHAFFTAEDLVLTSLAFAAVEDDEMTGLAPAAVHVACRLLQPFADRPLQALVQHLAFDHELVRRSGGAVTPGPHEEKIRASPSEAILAFDASSAVRHSLQERLQQKLRAGLGVVETPQPVLGMLTEGRLEGGEQLVDVDAALGVDVPGGVLHQPRLRGVGELAWHDFGVDGVRDAQGVVAGDQAEVADVLQVAGGEWTLVAPAQQRLDDAANPIFLELVRELIQVSLAAENQTLLGVEDVARGDWERSRPASSSKQAPWHSAFTSQGWPRVCLHTVSTASGVNA